MKRFLMFPLIMGICGALFMAVCYAEFVFAQYPIWKIAFKGPNFYLFIERFLVSTALWGLFLGVVAGICFASWDRLRNFDNETSIAQLPINLFWCLLYATLITALNCAISNSFWAFNPKLIQYPGGASYLYLSWLIRIIGLGAVILNFTAIIWAAIRSITTNDVLTPRVLRDKLRRSSRLS